MLSYSSLTDYLTYKKGKYSALSDDLLDNFSVCGNCEENNNKDTKGTT